MTGSGYYLWFEGIEGESVDADHEGWCDLQTVGNQINRPMAEGASGSQRHRSTVIYDALSCTKRVDAASPKLQEAAVMGTNFNKVYIELCTSSSGGKRIPYLKWELTNVVVHKYDLRTSNGIPEEELVLSFEEILVWYDVLDKKNESQGSLEYSFNTFTAAC